MDRDCVQALHNSHGADWCPYCQRRPVDYDQEICCRARADVQALCREITRIKHGELHEMEVWQLAARSVLSVMADERPCDCGPRPIDVCLTCQARNVLQGGRHAEAL